MPARIWGDEKLDRIIGVILQVGVLSSGVVVLAGGILYLIQHGRSLENYRVFSPGRGDLRSIPVIAAAAAHFDSRAIIQLGILLLIATPVIRVVFSVVAFGLQRDRIYVSFTLIVLGILFYSLFSGLH